VYRERSFLSAFFNRKEKALQFGRRLHRVVEQVKHRVQKVERRPNVLWGDIYEQTPVIESSDTWMAEFVEIAGGNYMTKQMHVGFHQALSLEAFYGLGKDCDILFSYRMPDSSVRSKADMMRIQPLLSDIRPLNRGRVILNRRRLHQSMDSLDAILLEMAAILHPEIFGKPDYRYFYELR